MEGGFDMIQNHVDLLSGKVHAVPTRAATAAEAAESIRCMCLRSGDGFPDVLVVDHDPKFTSEVFRAFVKSMGLCPVVGSAYRKNTNAKVERANSVIGDALRAHANGRKDDWDRQLPLAVFAIHNAASTLGDGLTPFFIDRGAHPRLPRQPATPTASRRHSKRGGCASRSCRGGSAWRRRSRSGRRSWTRAGSTRCSRWGPGAAADQGPGAARRCGHGQAAAEVGRAFHSHGLP
jgi:hypothetical protein